MDTTLVDFNDMKWERGDITFIFNGEAKPSQSLTVLDNKLKVFQRIRYEVCEAPVYNCFYACLLAGYLVLTVKEFNSYLFILCNYEFAGILCLPESTNPLMLYISQFVDDI